jgi:hypothetical protein
MRAQTVFGRKSRERKNLRAKGECEMAPSEIVIHARYAPDGTCMEIGERPTAITPQQWFKYLYENIGETAQALAGGRMIFRVAATDLEKHQTAAAA